MLNVLILGAGASHSTSQNTSSHKSEEISPPLLKEIFQKAKQLNLINPEDSIWLEIKKGFGISLDDLLKGTVNFEQVLSILDIYSQHAQRDSAIKFPTPFESYLKGILVQLLKITTGFVMDTSCVYHKAIAKTLRDGDTIISFNYDLIMDSILLRTGKWNQESGYMISFDKMLTSNEKDYNWSVIPRKGLASKVYLLKLHGSLNWISHSVINRIGLMIGKPWSPLGTEGLLRQQQIDESELRLIPIDKAYEFDIAKLREQTKSKYDEKQILAVLDEFVILPPTYFKEVFQTKINPIWMTAAKVLSKADQITIIGYSYPDADLLFHYIFRRSIANNKKKSIRIEVVNPDNSVSKKIENMISRPVSICLFKDMESYVKNLISEKR